MPAFVSGTQRRIKQMPEVPTCLKKVMVAGFERDLVVTQDDPAVRQQEVRAARATR
jgi:hypothetical protein